MPSPRLCLATTLASLLTLPALGQEFTESSTPLSLSGPSDGAGIVRDGERLILRQGTAAIAVHERAPDGSWPQVAEIERLALEQQLGDTLDGFGAALDLEGDRIAIGCADSFPGSTSSFASGAVLLLERQPTGDWQLAETFTGTPGQDEFAAFGFALDLAGDTLIVGEPSAAAPNGVRTGAVHVFQEAAPGVWSAVGQLGPGGPVGDAPDNLGVAVAANAAHLAAASFAQERVATWLRVGGQWQLEAPGLVVPATDEGSFGLGLQLVGDRLAVLGLGDPFPATPGAVEFFRHDGTLSGWQAEGGVTAVTPGAVVEDFGAQVLFTGDRLYATERFFEPDPAGGIFPVPVDRVRRFDRDADGNWLPSGQYRASAASGGLWPTFADEQELWLIESTGLFEQVLAFDAGAFEVESPAIPLGAGGVQGQWLYAGPERAGDLYLILGSNSGTTPGIDLGSGVLPLVPDAYFDFCLQGANAAFGAQVGVLDAAGRASSDYTLPPGLPPSLVGVVSNHAFVTLDPLNAAITSISEAAALEFLP